MGFPMNILIHQLIWSRPVAGVAIGWLTSQRNTTLEKPLKIVSALGYTIFFVTICIAFIRAYRDLHLILIDLKNLTEILELQKIHEGYIGYLLRMEYPESKA